MQKFTKGLVQITDLLEPPPLYNGLWGGGRGSKKFLGPPPPQSIIQSGVVPTNPLEITLFANLSILVKNICRYKCIQFKNAKIYQKFYTVFSRHT